MDNKTFKMVGKNGTNYLQNGESRIVRNCLLILKVINSGRQVNRNDLKLICGVNSTRTITRYINVLRNVGYKIEYNSKNKCFEIVNKDIDLNFLDS